MTTVPRQVEYALMALATMHRAAPGRLFAVRALCDDFGAPFDVMSRALQRLARAGVLRSVKGVHGGYQLIRNLADVTFLELMEAVMGPVAAVQCQEDGKPCPRTPACNLKGSMAGVNRRLREIYRNIPVVEMLDGADGSAAGRGTVQRLSVRPAARLQAAGK